MPLTTPPLVPIPFANNGDKTVVPQTDPSGFVSFTSGYTPDYELNLASGDPQAKAVERGIQNYLFNALTTGLKAWQVANRPPWYATMPGGYQKYAEVVLDIGDGLAKPFRSLVSGNVANPANSPNWEYLEGTGELVRHIPMPTGGPAGPGSYVIGAATDFNTLSASGSYQFKNDAVVNGSPNAPQNGGNKAQAGMLETSTWVDGVNTYATQFYRDKAGLGFMRGAVNGTWSAWKIWANTTQFVVGEIRMWNGAASQAAVTAAYGPGWHLCDGSLGTPDLRNWFVAGAGAAYATATRGGASSVTLAVANMPAHNHVINIGDPTHAHSVYDPGHGHGINDPGHNHGVADGGHAHGVNDPTHNHGIYDPGHSHTWAGGGVAIAGSSGGFFLSNFGNTGTSVSGTGIGINGNYTGVSIQGSGANIGIYGNGTGISIGGSGTGVQTYAAGTGIYANSNNTGGGAAFATLPPFYAVAFVMFTGA
jgi:hypothetical protein